MPDRDPHEARTDHGATDPVNAGTVLRGFGARRRMLLVIVTLLLMVFLAAPTTKIYLDQRAEIRSLEQSIEDNRTTRDELSDEVALWEDPAYVRQQARDRLLMVEPGQRSYLVVGADTMGDEAPESSAVQEEADRPAWADALWGSVMDAGWPEERTTPSQAENFPQLGGSSTDSTEEDSASDDSTSDQSTTDDADDSASE